MPPRLWFNFKEHYDIKNFKDTWKTYEHFLNFEEHFKDFEHWANKGSCVARAWSDFSLR